MDEVLEEFESYVSELDTEHAASSAAGTDGVRAQVGFDELVQEYRAKLKAEESPAQGRALLQRFKQEVRLL